MTSLILSIRLIRRIPNVFRLLLITLIAGIAEGIGISSLVPMVSSLTESISDEDLSAPFSLSGLPDIYSENFTNRFLGSSDSNTAIDTIKTKIFSKK
jgi:hypothetical protein